MYTNGCKAINYLLAETAIKPFFDSLIYISLLTSSLLAMVITSMISHMLKMWLMPIYVLNELWIQKGQFQKKLLERYH